MLKFGHPWILLNVKSTSSHQNSKMKFALNRRVLSLSMIKMLNETGFLFICNKVPSICNSQLNPNGYLNLRTRVHAKTEYENRKVSRTQQPVH